MAYVIETPPIYFRGEQIQVSIDVDASLNAQSNGREGGPCLPLIIGTLIAAHKQAINGNEASARLVERLISDQIIPSTIMTRGGRVTHRCLIGDSTYTHYNEVGWGRESLRVQWDRAPEFFAHLTGQQDPSLMFRVFDSIAGAEAKLSYPLPEGYATLCVRKGEGVLLGNKQVSDLDTIVRPGIILEGGLGSSDGNSDVNRKPHNRPRLSPYFLGENPGVF